MAPGPGDALHYLILIATFGLIRPQETCGCRDRRRKLNAIGWLGLPAAGVKRIARRVLRRELLEMRMQTARLMVRVDELNRQNNRLLAQRATASAGTRR